MKTVIGIDFDNTIVCYDEVFHKVALELNLIPANIPTNKESVRNYLRKIGQEDAWTELQGYVYGMRMNDAFVFPGLINFLNTAKRKDISIYIVSHKTLNPYLGPKYDLHKAAREWLNHQGFFEPNSIGLDLNKVFFELSIDEKIKRISTMECQYFIDDLPEIFLKENFPKEVNKILFDPHRKILVNEKIPHSFCRWDEISNHLLGEIYEYN